MKIHELDTTRIELEQNVQKFAEYMHTVQIEQMFTLVTPGLQSDEITQLSQRHNDQSSLARVLTVKLSEGKYMPYM